MYPNDSNGWEQWSKHVLIELKRLDADLKKIDVGIQQINVELAMLKIKAGIWGAMAGMVPVLIAIAVQLITSK